MKSVYAMTLAMSAAVLAGCTSSSRVQEMIDASHRDHSAQISAHEESISVLKQSAMAGLEKGSANADRLNELEKKVAALVRQITIIQDLANASKVMSAENTVKISNLDEQVAMYAEENDKVIARMTDIDKLYEEVLIRQYQALADSAKAAVESLKEDGLSASTNAPVKLDAPIEIVAPDTAALTNIAEPASSSDPVRAE